MKVKVRLLGFSLVTIILFSAAFIGCTQKPASADINGNGLRDDVELKILEYHAGKNVNPNNWDISYFGIYGDAVVVRMIYRKSPAPSMSTSYNVSGFEFLFDSNDKIRVWYADKLYELPEAYELEILTAEDIEDIYTRRYEH